MIYMDKFLSEVIVLDTETSSYDINVSEIIEIAFGLHADGDWQTIATQFKPQRPITAEAMSCSWITNEEVQDKKTFIENVEATEPYLNSGAYLVAHNATFDKEVLINNHKMYNLPVYPDMSDNSKWICTLKLARKLFRNDKLPQFKLGFLWFHLGLHTLATRPIVPHRADSDIYMCGKLLEYIVQELIDLGEINASKPIADQLIAYQNAPVYLSEFPFGKHKGKNPEDIPDDYYVWLINKSDALDENSRNYDVNLAHTIEVIMNKRLGA